MAGVARRILRDYWLLLVFVAAKMILQYVVVNPVYELHRDEFLHLDQANHLAAGFISVPPFISWVSSLIFILGGSLFWIRFFPALFGALTMVFAWLLVDELKGSVFAKVLVMCALLFSVFARLNILYQPVSFDILAWTAVYYFLVRYIRTQKPLWLFMLMIVFVAGFYNKYNIIFLFAGIVAGILLTGSRKIFFNRNLVFSAGIGLLLVLPNLIWQISHRFPVMHHMQVLSETQLVNDTATGFLADQAIYYSGSIVLVITALLAFFFYKPFRPYRAVGISFITVIVLNVLLKGKSYYASGLYPAMIVFGGVCIDNLLARWGKKTVITFLVTANIAVFVLTFRLIFPVLSPQQIMDRSSAFAKFGMLRWEDGQNHHLPQDFADMLGWEEMAAKSLRAWKTIPVKQRPRTLVFCDNYGQTGALNYYNRGKMSEAYSFSTDYIFWLPRLDTIENVLLLGNRPPEEVIRMFNNFEKVDSTTNPYAREQGKGIYLLEGGNSEFTKFFYDETDRRIKDFDIF
ncbi:MAG TPA: glycosyltransferase family 39 protein [Bacteroidales bacterium]|nr:glycosyltransferase family 39 protein [Bacteroidales bacterium]